MTNRGRTSDTTNAGLVMLTTKVGVARLPAYTADQVEVCRWARPDCYPQLTAAALLAGVGSFLVVENSAGSESMSITADP